MLCLGVCVFVEEENDEFENLLRKEATLSEEEGDVSSFSCAKILEAIVVFLGEFNGEPFEVATSATVGGGTGRRSGDAE
jgi:hypothetical protein